jgi:hypothetical protein
MSDFDVYRLWREYIAAEQARYGDVLTMNQIVNRFVDQLLLQSTPTWYAWALDLAREVADEELDIPIRLPLFRRVLLPALVEGIKQRRPGCARQLAHFSTLLLHARVEATAAGLPPNLRDNEDLLAEALRVDPADTRARRKLVRAYADALDFSIHEAPDYVIADSPQRCEELLDLLAAFRRHVDLLSEAESYRDLIHECDRHFRAWRDYLVAGRPGGSYEKYLMSREKEG